MFYDITGTLGDMSQEEFEKNEDEQKVASTKLVIYAIPDEDEKQESDPLFEIIFTYKNGKSDKIESAETGRYIFRRLLASGWVGGPCDDILVVIKNLAARNR